MPTKRKVMAYQPRMQFSPEVLELFVELEGVKLDDLTRKYKQNSLRLAVLLGLGAEWWAMQNVNTRRWLDPRVRAVRQELLEAVEQKKARAAEASAGKEEEHELQ
jgi:hypothetical protein